MTRTAGDRGIDMPNVRYPHFTIWKWMVRVATAVVVVVVVLSGFSGVSSAAPLPVGRCGTTSGVIVAVDMSRFGGPVLRSCGTTPTTGYALLNQGGWHTSGTRHDGPGFICRIGYASFHGGAQYPTASHEACNLTPPTSAYWSYWHANPGQHTWSYSQLGAMSYHPKPGSVDLWVFGATNTEGTNGSGVPTISPDSVRNAAGGAPTSTPTRPAPTQPAPIKPAPIHTGTPAADPTARPGLTTALTPAPTPASTTASTLNSTPAGAAAASSAQPSIMDAPPVAAAAHASHGSATPAIVALAIVLLLAAGGIAAVLRRPRRDE